MIINTTLLQLMISGTFIVVSILVFAVAFLFAVHQTHEDESL